MKYASKTVLLILLGIFLQQGVKGQNKITEFSSDSVKFLKELEDYLQTGLTTHSDVKTFMEQFTVVWKTGAYTSEYKNATVDISNEMLAQHIPVYPQFQAFLNSMQFFVKGGFSETQFTQWRTCLEKLVKRKPLTNLGNYLTTSVNLFGSGVLFKSQGLSWNVGNSSFRFNCDSDYLIVFDNLNLVSTDEHNDSLDIYNTHGSFSILKGLWRGTGGKIDWTRTGLEAKMVYGELKNYSIKLGQNGFVADSVTFWNKYYFKAPLLGTVIEKNIYEPKGQETYPRFQSYGKRFDIANLTPDITYNGGFYMKGGKFVGSGTTEEPARLIFKRKGKVFLEVESVDYKITKEQISADDARIIIHIDTDSIYHPDIQVVYNIAQRHLSFIRTNQGLSQSPYFDSYHNVNWYFEYFSWYLDQPKFEFRNLPGSAQNIADFESKDYFRPDVFTPFANSMGANFIMQVADYCKTINGRDFTIDALSGYLNIIPGQVESILLTMATMGLVNYNEQNNHIHAEDKLFKYVADDMRKSDYDVIDFHSVDPGSQRGDTGKGRLTTKVTQDTLHKNAIYAPDNGVMDLTTNDMNLYGIKVVIISDSQGVYLFPKNREITLHRNRDFDFAGSIQAGRFDFFGKHFSFKYDQFKIKMVNTDSIRILAESFETDAKGRHHLVPVKSVIERLTGELAIDRPDNKSGIKGLHNYPVLRSDSNSFVYYDKRSIQGGAYKRDNFYFRVDPFTIDSLARFTNAGLHFGGMFSSAGIVPDMREELRLQSDYSLGFVHDAPEGGIALYGGKGKFFNKLRLSNRGFKGGGTINYVTSVSKSEDFTFYPDSMNAVASSFTLKEQKTPPEFPQVYGDTVREHWMPKKDFMDVSDLKLPFQCYNHQSTFHGHLQLSPELLTGGGLIDFQKAYLTSHLIRFKQHKFMADTADFFLKKIDSTGGIAFNTKNMNSEVDFEKRMGEFLSNGGGSMVGFPVNKYIAFMDEFKWYMDQEDIDFSSNKTQQAMSEGKQLQFSGSKFISVEPHQDSLQFIAPTARFSLKNYLISAHNVPFINVADAQIIPDSGNVYVRRNAAMDPLVKSTIIANTVTKYYKLYNSDVNISSRKKYDGSGYFDFIDELKNKRPIFFSNIHVDTTHQTIASTTVADSAHFAFSPNFKFKGDVKLIASNPFLFFDGECRIAHSCNEIKISWVKFASQVDPNNIMIPVNANPVNEDKTALSSSPVLSVSPDSVYLYPTFLSPVVNPKHDNPLLADSGFLTFDKTSGQYRISSKEKLAEQSVAGNYISLDTRRCILYNEGIINLGVNLGQLDWKTAGSATDYITPDSVTIKAIMSFNFFFDDGALEKMSTDMSNFVGLKPFDFSKQDYQKSLREILGKDKADKLITQLTLYGAMKKLPKDDQFTLFLSQVNLKWNSSLGSYVSEGPIGVGSMGKAAINKLIYGKIELRKGRRGDQLNMYLELDPMHWYFFNYNQNVISAYSSNSDFNNAISSIKSDKREQKTDKGKFIFQPADANAKTIFLRRVMANSDNQ